MTLSSAELILPDIVCRPDPSFSRRVPKGRGARKVPLDYFFDRRHLNDSLTAYCPQMKLHSSMNDFYDRPSMLVPLKLSIAELSRDVVNGTVLAKPQQLGKQLEAFLEEKSPGKKRTYPLHVHLATSRFMFPTAYDPAGFAANFGRLLRIREDARRLAGSALFNMQKLFHLDLDPRNGIRNESFLGIHLRTEKDAKGIFPDYETQAADYLNYMARHQMGVVFMATGATGENVTAFTDRASDFNATVVTKKDLLEGVDLAALESLSWDQRALVDYEIMLRAGLVAGPTKSSFIWNLAMRRKNVYGPFGKTAPRAPGGSIQWQDQYSIIFGSKIEGQSMQLTIWP